MEQVARVLRVFADGTAEVIRTPEESCSGNCGACAGCQDQKPFVARNPVGAQVDDLVLLEPDAKASGKVLAMLCTIPTVLLLAGYLLGEHFLGKGPLVGLACGVLGIWLVLLLDRKMTAKNPITYVIVGKMKEKGDNALD